MSNPEASNIPAVDRPRLRRLALQVEPDVLRAVVTSTVDDGSLLRFNMPLDPTLPLHKALEEAVYAAPVLLSDFAKVDVVVRTRAFTPVPAGLSAEACEACADASAIFPASDRHTIMHTDRCPDTGIDIVWAIDADTDGFIARTFRNPAVVCHITPLLRWFSRKSLLGNSGKLYAHLHPASTGRMMDIIVFGPEGHPEMVASRTLASMPDALYFILASARQAGLDLESDDILLCGDASARDALLPELRRYVAHAMPAIFPSAAFKAGREAFNAPFPLVILPLCE